MNYQEKMLHDMTDRLSSFCPGSFGITGFRGSGSPALFTERCVYPVAHMNLYIADQTGLVLIHGADLPSESQLLLDNRGEDPAHARLALTRGEKEIIALSGESPIQSSVLVIAGTGANEQPAFAISAIFGIEDARQTSSILWDTSSDLITHWLLQSKLLGKGDLSYASKQCQPQPSSSEYDETGDVFQYFQAI